MSRKEIERKARQGIILNAARELYASQGIEITTMDDIAQAVQYTRRTLYAYFQSHDEICLLTLIEDMQQRWALQKKAVALADKGIAKIRAWGEALYVFAKENPLSIRLQVYWDFKGIDSQRFSDDVRHSLEQTNNELADGLRQIFQLGLEDGSLRGDLEIDPCISQYLYSLRAVIHRALSPTYTFTQLEPDQYVRSYLDLFIRGIGSQG